MCVSTKSKKKSVKTYFKNSKLFDCSKVFKLNSKQTYIITNMKINFRTLFNNQLILSFLI